jgi:hypothetical protein
MPSGDDKVGKRGADEHDPLFCDVTPDKPSPLEQRRQLVAADDDQVGRVTGDVRRMLGPTSDSVQQCGGPLLRAGVEGSR